MALHDPSVKVSAHSRTGDSIAKAKSHTSDDAESQMRAMFDSLSFSQKLEMLRVYQAASKVNNRNLV